MNKYRFFLALLCAAWMGSAQSLANQPPSEKGLSMILKTVDVPDFYIVGIAMKTTNENLQCLKDIPPFWERFVKENVMDKIANKKEPRNIVAMYTDYEPSGAYTMIIGLEVTDLKNIPQGMVGKKVPATKCAKISENGAFSEVVGRAWRFVWSPDFHFPRTFVADYECYGLDKLERGAVDIYVTIK